MNRECLRTGDKASVHFRFIKTPEYLHTDRRLVFREGRTKAVGTITKTNSCTQKEMWECGGVGKEDKVWRCWAAMFANPTRQTSRYGAVEVPNGVL
ncbi:hypothetical protein NFI96_009534 [Prochilodus magdalenae]|nr:hypothetical protein NFI96_009534 [Prochilodus magdalenae]